MKPMKSKRTRRLRARAATMHEHDEEYEDYGPEPNMKLSHAFMVVLLLHVVAVGGLYLFNSMKHTKGTPSVAAQKPAASEDLSVPVARQTAPGSGNQDSPEPQNQQTDNGGKEPSEKKVPAVAKTAEAPKAAERAPAQQASEAPKSDHKGLLSSMRGALEKAAGITAVAGGTAHAVAQDSNGTATQAAATPVAAGDAVKTYTVKAGDTITRIASSLGVSIPDLEKINGLVQTSVLQVGQILKVPEQAVAQAVNGAPTQAVKAEQGSQQADAPAPAAAAATAGEIVSEYTVVKGDNPYKIAKRFKITPDELMKANGITDPKKIQIGQQLKIPASSKKSAKSAK
jgi:LysM repeat protein